MSQIWCNSAKLMTALLGMSREGMISVSSSIWSVPLAGWLQERRCSNICLRHTGYMAHTHIHKCTHPKIIPVSPRSSLSSDSGPAALQATAYLVRPLGGAVRAITIEHFLMGRMLVPVVVWLHSGKVDFFFFLFQHVQYFKGKWGIQFR